MGEPNLNCTREESESTSRQQIHSFEPSCPVVAQPPGPSEIDRASFKMPEATATPRHEPEDPSEEGSVGLPDLGDSIDAVTFEQILEMDDDEDDREFSRSIVFSFFEQAEQTFKKMDDALEEKDLATLSSLGHFLKGSSATLGLTKVKDSCEKIQHFGQKKDETGTTDISEEEGLAKLKTTIEQAKQ